jgi:putative transposase
VRAEYTPAERHRGDDKALLKKRDELYCQAQKIHPERGSGKTRNWQLEGPVALNPEREK